MPMKKNKNLKKTLIIFYVLVLICLAQLGWWSIQLMRSYDQIDALTQEVKNLKKAQIISEVHAAVYKRMFAEEAGVIVRLDSVVFSVDVEALRAHFEGIFPGYVIRINGPGETPITVEQDPKTAGDAREFITSRATMVFSEGGFFIVLIVIAGYTMYRAFQTEYDVNRRFGNFLLSITHELKSPLSAIKLNLQTVMIRELNKADCDHFVQNAVEEVDRLHDLVENVLIAARIEQRGYQYTKEPLELAALIREHIDRFLKHSRVRPEIQADLEPVGFEGDRVTLGSVFHNVFENAVKYSGPDPKLYVRLHRANGGAVIEFGDNGTGIPDSEKEKVFERFYRVGNENTRASKGTGLGLYIVREVVSRHDGTVRILDNKPRGTVVRIELPKG